MLNIKWRVVSLWKLWKVYRGFIKFANNISRPLIYFPSTRLFARCSPTKAHYPMFWTGPMKGRREHYNIAKNTYERGEGGSLKAPSKF